MTQTKHKVVSVNNWIYKKIIFLLCLLILAIAGVSVAYRYFFSQETYSYGLEHYFAKQEGETSTNGRGYPVFSVYSYDGNKTKKIFTAGKKGEYVRDDFLFLKSEGIIVINLENKLLLYYINSKKTQSIQFNNEEIIGSVIASPKEDELILNVRNGARSKGKFNKTIAIDIDTLTQKILYEDSSVKDFEAKHSILVPDFKFSQEQMLVKIAPIEGWHLYGVVNLTNRKLAELYLKDGLVNKNSFYIASADDFPPYGGCLFAQEFNIRLHNLKTNVTNIIFTKKNTRPKLVGWNPEGNILLYETQGYTPEDNCDGNGLLTEKVETYIFKVKTSETNKIASAEDQMTMWYPEKYTLYKKFGKEIIYLGKIER